MRPRAWIPVSLVAFGAASCTLVFGDFELRSPLGEGGSGGGGGASEQSSSSSGGGTSTSSGSTSSGSTSSGSTSTGSSGGPTCPGTGKGPALVLVPGPGADGSYCVDASEVTMSQYQAWLQTNPKPANNNDPVCGWNMTYTPAPTANDCADVPFAPTTTPDLPVLCVDWCDARDFCAWAGKRLCGLPGGGAADFSAGYAVAATDEWTNACSKGGTQVYPYGNTYGPGTCVGADSEGDPNPAGSGTPKPVESATGCVGGYPGLYDMSGNVWEWEDSCQGPSTTMPQNDECHTRGGSFWETEASLLTCTAAGPANATRSYVQKNIGIRCCADTQ